MHKSKIFLIFFISLILISPTYGEDVTYTFDSENLMTFTLYKNGTKVGSFELPFSRPRTITPSAPPYNIQPKDQVKITAYWNVPFGSIPETCFEGTAESITSNAVWTAKGLSLGDPIRFECTRTK